MLKNVPLVKINEVMSMSCHIQISQHVQIDEISGKTERQHGLQDGYLPANLHSGLPSALVQDST
jgi:hypothetical protein